MVWWFENWIVDASKVRILFLRFLFLLFISTETAMRFSCGVVLVVDRFVIISVIELLSSEFVISCV